MANQLAMQALDKKLDAARWAKSPQGTKYVHGLANIQDQNGDNLANIVLCTAAEDGELFVLAADLGDVILEAADTMPTYKLMEHDLPCTKGFLYMEKPLVFLDSNDKGVVIRALGWVGFQHDDLETKSIAFVAWTDVTDSRDDQFSKFPCDVAVNLAHMDITMVPMLAGMWTIGEELNRPRDHFIYPFMLAFYRFIQEPYVQKAVADVGRHAVKRAKRANQDPTVTIVKLRKKANVSVPSNEPNPVEWKNRWVVGPFWRNQYYPSLGVHRPKYIMAYIKGPEDKPLKVKSKVNIVDR